MTPEQFDKHMCESYPLLFSDRNGSMMETALCWGFCTGPGWNQLLDETAAKLEPLIQKIIDAEGENLPCRYCGMTQKQHDEHFTKMSKFGEVKACEEFLGDWPRASQVKEKFGGLRLYLTSGTEEMWKIVAEGEGRSVEICDECGKPGKIVGKGWLMTRCEEHAEVNK